MKLYVKNMVCDRCKVAIRNELDQAGIGYRSVELGEIELSSSPSVDQLENFKAAIVPLGFELIEDKPAREVSKIKKIILDWVRSRPESGKRIKFSAYLSDLMHKEYSSLSTLFTSVEGVTIEHYLIQQKVEFVKELLVYNESPLVEISDQLGYSSVQHLSNQFKKVTGLTPSHFKKIGAKRRRPLDQV